jgi:hypothetical protein
MRFLPGQLEGLGPVLYFELCVSQMDMIDPVQDVFNPVYRPANVRRGAGVQCRGRGVGCWVQG